MLLLLRLWRWLTLRLLMLRRRLEVFLRWMTLHVRLWWLLLLRRVAWRH